MKFGFCTVASAAAHRGWAVSALGLLLIAAVPVRGQVVNGGFEAGGTWVTGVGPTGWTAGGGKITYSGTPAPHSIYTELGDPGKSAVVSVGNDPFLAAGGISLPMVEYGSHAVRINDGELDGSHIAGQHYTTIKQTFTLGGTDSELYFAWAAVLEDPGHSEGHQPSFMVQLTDLGTPALPTSLSLYSKLYDATTLHSLGTTVVIGLRTWVYTNWQVAYVTGLDPTHNLELFLRAADCADESHAGYAYLDTVGTSAPSGNAGSGGSGGSSNGVGAPEPGTVALGLCALAMAGGHFLLKLHRRRQPPVA